MNARRCVSPSMILYPLHVWGAGPERARIARIPSAVPAIFALRKNVLYRVDEFQCSSITRRPNTTHGSRWYISHRRANAQLSPINICNTAAQMDASSLCSTCWADNFDNNVERTCVAFLDNRSCMVILSFGTCSLVPRLLPKMSSCIENLLRLVKTTAPPLTPSLLFTPRWALPPTATSTAASPSARPNVPQHSPGVRSRG